MTGICISIKIRSNGFWIALSNPIWPSSAVVTCRLTSSRSSRTRSRFSLPSSTTSTRSPLNCQTMESLACSVSVSSRPEGWISVVWEISPVAVVNVNVLPSPFSLSAKISPFISSAKFLLIVRPRPVPPNWRVTEVSAWANGSKMLSSWVFEIPIPESRTWICNRLGSESRRLIVTRTPPSEVNLIALPTKFVRICRILCGSLMIVSGIGVAELKSNWIDFSAAFPESTWKTSRIIWMGWQGMFSISTLPASTFERSRMSLIRSRRCFPLEWIVFRYFLGSFCLPYPRRKTSVKPRMAFIGVRISWLMLARKSLFAWLAASAASFATPSSFFFSSSWVTSSKPIRTPPCFVPEDITAVQLALKVLFSFRWSKSWSSTLRWASPVLRHWDHGRSCFEMDEPSGASQANSDAFLPIKSLNSSPTKSAKASLTNTIWPLRSTTMSPSASVSKAERTRGGMALVGSSALSIFPR